MQRQPLALGALSGSLASLGWQLLGDFGGLETSLRDRPIFECPICPGLFSVGIDPFSLCLGILIGVLLVPTAEAIWLIRSLWVSFLRRQAAQLSRVTWPLYRET